MFNEMTLKFSLPVDHALRMNMNQALDNFLHTKN